MDVKNAIMKIIPKQYVINVWKDILKIHIWDAAAVIITIFMARNAMFAQKMKLNMNFVIVTVDIQKLVNLIVFLAQIIVNNVHMIIKPTRLNAQNAILVMFWIQIKIVSIAEKGAKHVS